MKALAALALTGCAQVLGLDNTTLDTGDGSVMDVCAGVPASCVSTTGRTVCGQLFDTGANAGKRLTVATPTGGACSGTEGPCGFTIAAYAQLAYFAGDKSTPVAGTIDDCGRYVIQDVDLDIADVAIELTPPSTDLRTTATLVNGRPPELGEDKDVAAFALSIATTDAWANELAAPGIDMSSGFLLSYTSGLAQPTPKVQVANDGGVFYTNPPGSPPWAGFFSAGSRFGTLDPAATQTADTGTAIAVLPLDNATVQIEGQRTGSQRCKVAGLKQIANLWLHVLVTDC